MTPSPYRLAAEAWAMTDLDRLDYLAAGPNVGRFARQLAPGQWREWAAMLREEGRVDLREGGSALVRGELNERFRANAAAWLR